jgi:hypothetical protein
MIDKGLFAAASCSRVRVASRWQLNSVTASAIALSRHRSKVRKSSLRLQAYASTGRETTGRRWPVALACCPPGSLGNLVLAPCDQLVAVVPKKLMHMLPSPLDGTDAGLWRLTDCALDALGESQGGANSDTRSGCWGLEPRFDLSLRSVPTLPRSGHCIPCCQCLQQCSLPLSTTGNSIHGCLAARTATTASAAR